MSKKYTLELTENQIGLIRSALSIAIESDETFYTEGLTRDAQASADYRGLNSLFEMIDQIRYARVGK